MRKYLNKILASNGYEFSKIGRTIYFLEKLAKKQQEIKFIQVGANDGISHDNIFPFFKGHKCRGVLVEPLPHFFERLKLNYADSPSMVPLKIALHPTAKTFDIFSVNPKALHKYPHWVSGIASFSKDHLLDNGIPEIDLMSESVECTSLTQLVKDHDLFGLDYLQIDTEGFDDEIIKMIDFSIIKPKLIKFESVHLSQSQKYDTASLLKAQGYKLIDERRDMIALLPQYF
jgi:FkbM family methyltransferase